MDELYNQKERYTKYFFKIIEDLKNEWPTKDYKELRIKRPLEDYQLVYASASADNKKTIEYYKFSKLEFLCFKFYYLLKYKDYNIDNLCYFFNNFCEYMNLHYLKYINIFIIILKSKYNIKDILRCFCNILNYNYYCYDYYYNVYLMYLENLFFYNFFFITDIKKYIISIIEYNIFKCIQKEKDIGRDIYKDIIIKYKQPLYNILGWSKMREIWICLCIFAKPKKYII